MLGGLAAFCALLPAALGWSPATAASTVTWMPDLVHSRAEFTVSHLVVSKVRGDIPIASMAIVSPSGSVVPSNIEATLNVAHEDTDNHDRDADLRSHVYFDVEHYPTMHFQSTKIVPDDGDDFDVTGDLTIKNVTRTVEFPVHVEGRVPDEKGGTRIGYSAQLHIDRRDYGLVDNRFSAVGVLIVGYDVTIGLTAEATTSDPSIRAK
jgi:polyisoprenoid-binding protein YceI